MPPRAMLRLLSCAFAIAICASAQAQTTSTLNAVADTSLREAFPFGNDGIGTNLSIGSATGARERTLVRFDQTAIRNAISTRQLYRAEVELTITNGDYGWGGGQVAIHAMNRSWIEGNGTFGGTGTQGPTWLCAHDSNTGNQVNNCLTTDSWSVVPRGSTVVPWNPKPTDTSPLHGNWMTKLRFDVTGDVKRFLAGEANNGWFISDGGGALHGAWATFASRETSTPPKLIIVSGNDLCTADPNKVQPLACGCGVPDTDSDGDGVPDCIEPAVPAAVDTTLRQNIPYGNDGTGMNLGVTVASGTRQERALVRVDQAKILEALAGRSLVSAELEMTVAGIASGWSGGRMAIHRMTRSWPEGGALDPVLGAHGPSWACADDTNTSLGGLNTNDCTTANRWGMLATDTPPKPFDPTATNTQPLYSSTTKKVRFVVTSDVSKFLTGTANHGWMIKGLTDSGSGGLVNFASRETGAGPVLWIKTQPKAAVCANGSPPSANGCSDFLDAIGSELALAKRLAADPATPPADRPTGEEIKDLVIEARLEVDRVINFVPDDFALAATQDLRPYMVSLGRAFSTLLLAEAPPIGALPNGGRCADTLAGTTTDTTQPLFSQLFERLAYLDDTESLTRGAYRLADLQNLLDCLNRNELVLLDEAFTRSSLTILRKLAERGKRMAAIDFYDQLLPATFLVFDAAKYIYTPRAYQLFRLKRGMTEFPSLDQGPDIALTVKAGYGVLDSKTLIKQIVPFEDSMLRHLYCERPAKHYTLARFGIWLSDPTHGGQINRVRLGSNTLCEYLEKITDLARMGAGDCSMLQISYSGFQCRSSRTCNLAPSNQYRFNAPPGSPRSQLTRFGVAKTLAQSTNCSDGSADSGTPGGYQQSRPGTECLVRVDDKFAIQHPFIDCIAAQQGEGIQPVEPPPEPWKSMCALVECPEGQDCSGKDPTAETKENKRDLDMDGDTDEDGETDENCDSTCEVEKLGQATRQAVKDTVRDVDQTMCAGRCTQAGFESVIDEILSEPLPVTEQHGVDLPNQYGAAHVENGTVVIEYDDVAMLEHAYAQAAGNNTTAAIKACMSNGLCSMKAQLIYGNLKRAIVAHERGHALFLMLEDSGRVFNALGESLFRRFDQAFQNGLGPNSNADCRLGQGACSMHHEMLYNWGRRVVGGGLDYQCAIEGACASACGPRNIGYETGEACRTLTELIRNQYEQRIMPRCPPPDPNVGSIATECRFPGCFDSGIPAKSACPFALCTGEVALPTNIACECCSRCQPAPPLPGSIGTSPTCENEPICSRCCIHCSVPANSPCPVANGPTASELPPAWQLLGPD